MALAVLGCRDTWHSVQWRRHVPERQLMLLRRLLANGLWFAAGWNPERDIADEIARVYLMPEAACRAVWAGCEGGFHRCARRVGHDGPHRCDCGTPCANG